MSAADCLYILRRITVKKGIMFILIMCLGMVGLVMGAGMSEEMAGAISLTAAIAYAVLSGNGSEGDE